MMYRREMKLELELGFGLGSELVGSAGEEEKARSAAYGGSDTECITQGGIEEAFRRLRIEKREGV